MEVQVKGECRVRGFTIPIKRVVFNQKREDTKITQNDAYTVKELFQRYASGNLITAKQNQDVGTGAKDFSELCPLHFLDGDLTDQDTIINYINDYKERYGRAKQQQSRASEQQQPTE